MTEKKYKKLCPACNSVMLYKHKFHLNNSTRRNLICLSCATTKYNLTPPFLKKCPSCKCEMKYKQKSHLLNAIRKNILCKTCGYIKRKKIIPRRNISAVSKIETLFLNFLNIPLEKRQISIKNKCVDAYDADTNIIYEFLGDYWHGNLETKSPTAIHPVYKMTFADVNKNTFLRLNYLKSLGYIVKYIWENDWKKFQSKKLLTLKLTTL